MSDTTNNITVTKGENSQVTITGQIPAEELTKHRGKALEHIGKHLKVDGFRPGSVPDHIIEKQAGEMAILDEMAQFALSEWYPKILTEHKIAAIGQPKINITKLAAGNPLEFTITTAIMPTITLGDYKKIAKKANGVDRKVAVDDNEVEEAITQLRKFRKQAQIDEEKAKQAKESGEQFNPTKLEDIADEDLPELTVEYVQAMGDFKTVEEFTAKLRENLEEEKKKRTQEERRMEIIEGIIDASEFDIPDLLVDYEIDRAMAQLEHDIAMSGLELETYLQNIKKTKEELRESMRENASKRAKMRLVIEKLAGEEGLEPDKDKLEKEVKALLDMYKDNPNTSEESIRAYVGEVLLNQAVFEFLDNIK